MLCLKEVSQGVDEGNEAFGRKIVVGRGVDFGDVVAAGDKGRHGVGDVDGADVAEGVVVGEGQEAQVEIFSVG